MTADAKAMPPAGTVRIQPEGYPTVFRPSGTPVSPVLRWLREWRPALFDMRRTWRFSDPQNQYAETYSGTTLKDSAIEVFDRFRVDAITWNLAGAVRRPGGPRFAHPVGSIPSTELEGQETFVLCTDDTFADVMTTATQTWLSTRPLLMSLVKRHTNAQVIDSGTILSSGDAARVITQRLAREVYAAREQWSGIRYSSRVGTGHENWMIYDRCDLDVSAGVPLDPADPQLLDAVHELGLHLI